MTDYLTASMEPQSDALSMHVGTDRDQVTLTIGHYNDEEDVLHKFRINVVTDECAEVVLSAEDAWLLARRLIAAADYAELHGSEDDQHPDAIAGRNYIAAAKRLREEGR